MRFLLAACLLLGWTAATRAQSPPPRAQNWTDAYLLTCRTYGGRATIQPGYQTTIDLNGDGRADFIMDMRRIACSSREGAAAMCSGAPGTCTLFVYLSTAGGHRDPPQQFEVRGWSLARDTNPPALILDMAQGGGRYAWDGNAMAAVGTAATAAPRPAAAAQFPPASSAPAGQPPQVAEVSQELVAGCRGAGGQPTFLDDFQTIIDLNGDGQPDYVLDVERLDCSGAPTVLCAGAGCPVRVLVSTAAGYRDVSPPHMAKGWDLDVTTRPPTLLLQLDAAVCGRGPCVRAYQWNGTTLAELGQGQGVPPPAPAAATPPDAPMAPPPAVARAAAELMATCREAGGRPSQRSGLLTSLDLNGDGVADYILDATAINCEGAASVLCGSAGCPLQVFLSGPRGFTEAFGSNAQAWEVEQGNPPVLKLNLHGSFCGRVGAETCIKRYAWNGASFAELGGAGRHARPGRAGAGGEGGGKVETTLPQPLLPPGAWDLRRTAGNPPVAVAPGPGVIQTVTLLCHRGVPVAAFVLRAAPPPGKTIVSFNFSAGRVDLGIGAQQGGGRNVYYADLRGSPLPRLLAGRDSQAAIRINGGLQGVLSLAGSSAVVRQALADCYGF